MESLNQLDQNPIHTGTHTMQVSHEREDIPMRVRIFLVVKEQNVIIKSPHHHIPRLKTRSTFSVRSETTARTSFYVT